MKENELKVGDKVELLGGYSGFKKGQIVEVYTLCADGVHLFKGSNDEYKFCDREGGTYLDRECYKPLNNLDKPRETFETLDEHKAHPNADLILKYAMIAQYDDKPWESFECDLRDGCAWCDMITTGFHRDYKYRLKPQEPKIQASQAWVDSNGYEVKVTNDVDDALVTTIHELGGNSIYWTFSRNEFLKNFKRKE